MLQKKEKPGGVLWVAIHLFAQARRQRKKAIAREDLQSVRFISKLCLHGLQVGPAEKVYDYLVLSYRYLA
jgi:hypothetical protein